MKRPNFYIVGAPKCGTTALHHYLSEHPQAFMSVPKEPMYWTFDFPTARQGTFVPMESEADYLSLFADARSEHRVVGEASTFYLYSTEAIPRILNACPDARFVACVRNPINLIPSFHAQLLFSFAEDEPDFMRAWELQEERSDGCRIPRGCRTPEILQYRRLGRLGEQVERLIRTVPAKQRQIVVHDDFVNSPQDTYQQILRFLDLDDDHRTDFRRVNTAKRHRFPTVSRLVRKPPAFLHRPMRALRRWAGPRGWAPARTAKRLLQKKRSHHPVSKHVRQMLAEEFRDDIRLLGDLLNRNLDDWPNDV